MNIQDLERALADVNVQAFLRVLRERESNQSEDAYTLINGGSHFTAPPWVHPFAGMSTLDGGKAAGAYQDIPHTWDGLVRNFGFADFSPHNQDLGAVALIAEKGALGDVLLGDFGHAVPKLRSTWTSLPGASESSAGWTMEKAAAVYVAYGGKFAAQDTGETPAHQAETAPTAAPIPAPVPTPSPQPAGARMPILALITAFGPLLAQLIPQIAKAVNPQSEKTQQVLSVAQTVFDAVTTAAGAPNVQGAIEALQRDPALVQTVTKAVINDPVIMSLIEIGGGVQAARAADQTMAQMEQPFWKVSQAFWITVLCVMPPVDFMVYTVVSKMEQPSEQLITQIVTGLLSLIAVAAAFYFGTTQSSKQKDDTIATLSTK